MKEPGGSGMVLQRAGTHRATWLQVPVTIISFQILVDVDMVTGYFSTFTLSYILLSCLITLNISYYTSYQIFYHT